MGAELTRWYRKLHWQIILGLILGLLFGVVGVWMGWGRFIDRWITPFGTVFINLLKLTAVPLVLASLICGVASLSDLKKLSRIGGKTVVLYLATTAVAVTIGLLVVNAMGPGGKVPPELRQRLQAAYSSNATELTGRAEDQRKAGPLKLLEDIVPQNLFGALSDNSRMLQVVFLAILFGVTMIRVPRETARPALQLFESINALIIRLVESIMVVAPVGVFALIAGTIASTAKDDVGQVLELLGALGLYCLAVVSGLFVHASIVYPLLLKLFTPLRVWRFFKGIAPAQLLAFSTGSSGATLPVTMEQCRAELGVSEEVSSFVLPLGATINMDGTALYQAVAAVFIAQTLGMGLDLAAQCTIVLTAVLASIGTAAVPSAGVVMLVIILEAIGVPSAGVALILGVDRILDMLRTATNVTGDATVAVVVAASEGQLRVPEGRALAA